MKIKKVLVTGALGHIGSALIKFLPSKLKNSRYIILDNFLTERYCSLYNLKRDKNKIEFIEFDVSKDSLDIFKDKVDIVIHLAAITNAAESFSIKDKLFKNNTNCTKKVVNFCKNYKKKLIFISSTSVYGSQSNIVYEDSTSNNLNPQSPYAECKLKEEKLITKALKDENLYTILRFGTIYGKSSGMRFHTAVNKFCFQAAFNLPITVWETAFNQKRPYLSLNDACRAINHVINKNFFNNEIYNVLTKNMTVKDIINIIKKSKPNLEIKFVKSRIMNQLSYEVSNLKFSNTKFQFKERNILTDIRNEIKLIL